MWWLLLFLAVACAELTRTPFGLFPSECVHKVASGSHITTVGTQTVVTHNNVLWTVPPCHLARTEEKRQFPQDYNGWLAYTSFKTSLPSFDTFLGNFSVPNNPSNDPEVLYIFTGLQNVDWIPKVDPIPNVFDIIQPVLQYPADSGYNWSVKSWYVTLNAGVLYTDEVPCNSGDVIFGNMTRVSGSKWFIGSNVTSTGQVAGLTVDRQVLTNQPWAYTTVECYGCEDCSYLPTNTLKFTSMKLTAGGRTIIPKWKALKTPNPVCHTTAHIQDPATVTYTFQ